MNKMVEKSAKKIIGKVVSIAGKKTISVLVESTKMHPIYKKRFKISKKFLAHDEAQEAGINDIVEVEEIKPISKRKRLKLSKIIEKGEVLTKQEKELLGEEEQEKEVEKSKAEAESDKKEASSKNISKKDQLQEVKSAE